MKFIISRTSTTFSGVKPCECAELSEHKDCFGNKIWEIEVSSLEELVELKKKFNHPIVLCDSYDVKDMLELEIYDDYRE